MTYVTYTLYSPKSSLSSVNYALGRNREFTYDQLVIGFARSLADFMLNNDTITEPQLFEALGKITDALSSVSIQERPLTYPVSGENK